MNKAMHIDLTENTAPLVHLQNVSWQRNGRTLLHKVELLLPESGLVLFLGANGAGKSSLLKLLAGVSQVSSGKILSQATARIGWMPEPARFYDYLTVREHMFLQADLLALKNPLSAVNGLMEEWQLLEVDDYLAKHLSLGYRQRLSLAMALLGQPNVLLLDEPMNGMDPSLLQQFKIFLSATKNQTLVLMATHLLAEASDLADHCIIMHQGALLNYRSYQESPVAGDALFRFYRDSLAQWQQQEVYS